MFLGFPRKAFVTKLTPTRKIANVGAVADRDVNRFVLAAGITNHTEQTALYTLVFRLKNAGIWPKIRFLHPMVGGTAFSCSFNLRNPSVFQITWVNAPTFASTGVTGNGANQSGQIPFIPNAQLPVNNCALGVYVRNIGTGFGIGSQASGPSFFMLNPQATGSAFVSSRNATFNGSPASTGFFFATKTSDNRIRTFHNGVFRNQSAPSGTGLPAVPIALLGINTNTANNTTNFSNQEHALAIVTEALSDEESINLYNIIQEFQTILSRQV